MWNPPKSSQQLAKSRIMESCSKRSGGKNDSMHLDSSIRVDTNPVFNRTQSTNHESFFAPSTPFSPGSSIGASVSMFSSRNSEIGDAEDFEGGERTIMLHLGVSDMVVDKEIQTRYPEFFKFLVTENPTWFEPSPYNGTIYRVHQTSNIPENHKKLRGELQYEMLDLMYRFFRQQHVNAQRKRENKELLDANKQLRIAAVQMFTKAEQEEEFISNSLLKKIQQLNQDKDYLVKKYQKDEESLTKSLMANVAKIPDVHAETEKLMADKEAEIERLQAYCRDHQTELKRLRAEKIDHEAALEQEQELLINTLGKRMSQMKEDKRKMQVLLESAYLNGFVDYDETVEAALHASVNQKPATNNGPATEAVKNTELQPSSSSTSATRPHLSEVASLTVENKKLLGMCVQGKRRGEANSAEIKKLNARLSKMEAILDAIRVDAARSDSALAWRLAALSHDNNSEDQPLSSRSIPEKKQGSSPPTNIVIGQPSVSRVGPSSSNSQPEQPLAQVAPILATVLPTQRSTPARNNGNH